MRKLGDADHISNFNCNTSGLITLHAKHADTLNSLKSWDAISSKGDNRAIISAEPFQAHPERFEEPYNMILDGYSDKLLMPEEFIHYLDLARYAGELGVGISAWNEKCRERQLRIRESIYLITHLQDKADYHPELWPYLLDKPYAK